MFIHSTKHSTNRELLLCVRHIPGVGAGAVSKKTKALSPPGAFILVGIDNKVSKIENTFDGGKSREKNKKGEGMQREQG